MKGIFNFFKKIFKKADFFLRFILFLRCANVKNLNIMSKKGSFYIGVTVVIILVIIRICLSKICSNNSQSHLLQPPTIQIRTGETRCILLSSAPLEKF